jgi:hypothetical protein
MKNIEFPVDVPDKDQKTEYRIAKESEVTEELCGKIRELRTQGETYMEIADELGVAPKILPLHIKGECDCEVDVDPIENDKPWEEKSLMKFLHQSKNCWHYTDIADCFGCHPETVKNWVGPEHHNIKIIEDNERTSSQNVTRIHRIGIQLENKDSEEFIETLQERLDEIRESDKSLQDRLKEMDHNEADFEYNSI